MASELTDSTVISKKTVDLPVRNKRCNVIIEIGEDSFMAHKEVLTLRLKCFRSSSTLDIEEGDHCEMIPLIRFDPRVVDPAVFDDILDYLYTLDITFTPANLEPLLKAADFFRLTELRGKAESFIKNNLTKENVTQFLGLAFKFDLKVQEQCKQFIITNPPLESRDFIYRLNFAEFSSLLQTLSDLSKFEDMFNFAVDWILHDEHNRSNRMLELLKKIPLDRLPFNFFQKVISKNALVMKNSECVQLLFNSIISNPPGASVQELYVLGGRDGDELSSMSKYVSSSQEWFELSPMPKTLTHFAVTVVNQNIYVCGGHDGQSNLNSLFMFDTNTHKWQKLKPMKHSRQGCAMAALNGYLYVAGGHSIKERFSAVERYSIQNGRWENAPSMNTKRGGLELVQMNGFLYALGGYDGTSVRRSVEQFDPRTGIWTMLANMNHSYGWFGSAVLNNRLYVVGSKSSEVYYPEEDKWEVIPSPTQCRSGRRLVVLNGKLYTIGGKFGEQIDWAGRKTIECYDLEKRSWTPTNDMNIARCHHGVAVVTRK